MPEKKQKIPLTDQVKLPEDLGWQIGMEASRLGKFKYEVVRDAWQAYTNIAGGAIPNSGSPVATRKIPDEIGVLPDAPVLQNTGEAAWEHDALKEILESKNVTAQRAIRSNLHAFRQLVRSVPDDGERLNDARSRPLSEAEVDGLYQEGKDLIDLANSARRLIEKHPPARKRHRPPKKGTA